MSQAKNPSTSKTVTPAKATVGPLKTGGVDANETIATPFPPVSQALALQVQRDSRLALARNAAPLVTLNET